MSENVLAMSDEEIMNMNNPPETDETVDIEEHNDELTSNVDNNEELEENTEINENTSDITESTKNNDDNDYSDSNSDTIQQETDESPDYEGFYKRVMAPFKANGKQYNLKNADEVISLMQKGVDYTRKTQDISRYKKALTMLERANLLDENQISFFIDLTSGNKEAIRKLLKDKDIDAFSLPSEDEPINYVQGNHKISSEELYFEDIVKDISIQDNGKDFLKDFGNIYDIETRKQLYKNPNLLKALFVNKQSGVYDTIVEEMDRQKVLGQIPDNVPFIAAYKVIGDMLYGNGNNQTSRNGLYQQPLTRRPANTSNRLNNTQRAKAAGITRTSSANTSNPNINYLKMSDDDFIKQFGS